MEENKLLIGELVGKKVLVKTHGGAGIKDVLLVEGEYVGNLLAFDGTLLKLEYRVRKFISGVTNDDTKAIIFINMAYVITIEEFVQRTDQAD